jgi:hypothetical protein
MVQAKPIRILTVVRVHLRHLPLYEHADVWVIP